MGAGGRRGGRPTLEMVAERAGVGRGTVSRVINGALHVSPQARAAVEEAIAELGYVPNRAARALAADRTDAIALVIPEPETRLSAEPFFLDVLRGVSAELADTDMQLLLMLIRTPQERRRPAQHLEAGRVDGVLLVSVHEGAPLPDLLERLRVPTVLSGRRSERERMSYVDADNVGGARSATEHLLGRGRRTVATITGPLDMYAARCRLDGYTQAMDAAGHGVDRSLVAHGDFTEEGGRAAMRELLERHPGIDAVFAASDVMAGGALHVLRQAGRRVPDDVALVGFDDSTVARHSDPPLSSVRQPTEEMGRTMARVLLEEIESRTTVRRHVVLSTDLVLREST
ncbi:LacI family DNA-binding transcriptional regulator [Streptomyces sp. MK7]|uniref:LacI family DNA-binding transcriptional regulator n=1 Tax=Streptomyces sp. MK7 TaxID=3067635 RepID=UPI002930C49B|nr:LacI family DNA-binding transcriptional regulator [Streptomyces sp. MK7]